MKDKNPTDFDREYIAIFDREYTHSMEMLVQALKNNQFPVSPEEAKKLEKGYGGSMKRMVKEGLLFYDEPDKKYDLTNEGRLIVECRSKEEEILFEMPNSTMRKSFK